MNKINLFFAFAIMLSIGFVYSCSKDAVPTEMASAVLKNSDGDGREVDCEEDIENLEEREVFKVLFARFISEQMQDSLFKQYLLDEMYFRVEADIDRVSNEFFIADHLNDVISLSNGTTSTLSDLFGNYLQMLGNYQPLLSQICSEYYGVVLDFSWFGEGILSTHSKKIMNIKFGVFAKTRTITCNGVTGNVLYTEDDTQVMVLNGSACMNYLPIAVKEAEENIVFDDPNNIPSVSGTNFQELLENSVGYKSDCDISDIDFSEFVRTLDCSSQSVFDLFKLHKFVMSHCTALMVETECSDCLDNDGDGLVDCFDPDCNCDPEEICDNGIDDDCDGLVDQNDPDCPCNQNCSRDCVQDHTYLKAVAFPRPSSLYTILVPGESFIELNYNFVNVSICDPFNSVDCGATSGGTVNKTLSGLATQFFFPQGPWTWYEQWPSGPEPQIDVDGVYYGEVSGPAGQRVITYWKAWPIYVEVDWLMMGEWNGNAIGDQIKYHVVEYDGVSLSSNYSTTVSSTVSNQAQANSTSGNNPGDNGGATNSQSSSYTFSTGVSNSATVQHSLRYEKDYPLGEYRIFYCDENQSIPDPFGYTDDWYGFIPDRAGNLQLEPIIDLFEIK